VLILSGCCGRTPKDVFFEAKALYESDRENEAIELLETYVEKYPNNPVLNNYLGYIYRKQEQWDLTIKYSGRAVQLDNTFDKAHYNLAYALMKKGDLKGAKKHFELAREYARTRILRNYANKKLNEIQKLPSKKQ